MKIFINLSVIFFIFWSQAVLADTKVGCLIYGPNQVFTHLEGNSPHHYDATEAFPINFDINNPAHTNDCGMANPNMTQTGKNCSVVGYGYSNGEVTFSYISCFDMPLDDYIPFLMVFSAGLGLLIIRKTSIDSFYSLM